MTDLLPPRRRRKTRIGLVAGGLGAYWPQFPDLLPQLRESARYVSARLTEMDAEVTDAGFISDAQEGAAAAEKLRVADCDLIVLFLTTYLTASMVLPIAQRADTPVLVIDLQPTEKMDHASFDTGAWLAYCGQCPVPEMGNTFRRAGIAFRSVSGWLRQESAWERIGRWIRAAHVRAALRHARHGLMGHLYPGMLDVSTDLTLLPATFGSHVEVLEFDDLRVRVEQVTDPEVTERMQLARKVFTLDESVNEDDFAWGARVSVGLDRLVADFDLDSIAYYHRGLNGEQHERLILRTAGAELRRRRRRDGPRRASAPRGQLARPAAPRPRRLPRQAGLGRERRVRRPARPGHPARAGPGPGRQPVLHRRGGHGGPRPAAGHRQHHEPGLVRP
jgi:L-arabinose isomerase